MRHPLALVYLTMLAAVTLSACGSEGAGESGDDAAAGAGGPAGAAGAAGAGGPGGAGGSGNAAGGPAGSSGTAGTGGEGDGAGGGGTGGNQAGRGGGTAGAAGSAAAGRGGGSAGNAAGGRGGGSAGAAGSAAGGRGGGIAGAAGSAAGGRGGGIAGAAGSAAGGRGGGAGASAAITLWIAGDSTVANGSTPCPIGWGGQFKPYFNDRVSITNSAVGGRSVRTWLYNVQTAMDATGECVLDRDASGNPTLQARWQAMLASSGMKAGDYLFIQFGINDGSATCDRHVGLEAFKDSYGMMAQAAKDRGAQPVFLTPLSSISCSGSTARGSRGAYVTATQEAGTEYDVPVIDLHALSVALYNDHDFCPVTGGDVGPDTTGPVGAFFCDDHTHLEKAGAVEIAGVIVKAIRDQGLPLAAYLK